MDKRIKIVTISKNSNFSLTKIEGIEYVEFPNNTEKITTIYNNQLRNSHEYDFLVFMHGDVDVDLNHMIQHMIECSHKYDIMGLCGCQKMNISQSPLNWFTGSLQSPEFRFGSVIHGEDNNRQTFYNRNKPEIKDTSVACIDGLCMIFTQKAIQSGILFDEMFSFDFYDTDISFSA